MVGVMDLFEEIKSLFPSKQQQIVLDTVAVRLNKLFSIFILVVLDILCLWLHVKIDTQCVIKEHDERLNHFVNQYCNQHSFIHTGSVDGDGSDAASSFGENVPKDAGRIYLSNYAWTPHFLFLQGLLLWSPRVFMFLWAKNFLKSAIHELNQVSLSHERIEQDIERARIFFDKRVSKSVHVLLYLLYQLAYLGALLLSIYTLDVHLRGHFLTYGIDELTKHDNPSTIIFPTLVKCEPRMFSLSGSIDVGSVLCQLSMNYYNKYIFLVLWWFYAVLIIFNTGNAIFWTTALVSRSWRNWFLIFCCIPAGLAREFAYIAVYNGPFDDWVMIYIANNNIHHSNSLVLFMKMLAERDGRLARDIEMSLLGDKL